MFILLGTVVLALNVREEMVNSTFISVKWNGLDACNSQIVKYRVRYRAGGNEYRIDETRSGTSLTGLVPFTNYSIKVAAMNEEGIFRPYGDPITVQTPEDGM